MLRLTEAAAVMLKLFDGCSADTFNAYFYRTAGIKYNVAMMLGFQIVNWERLGMMHTKMKECKMTNA